MERYESERDVLKIGFEFTKRKKRIGTIRITCICVYQ